jgi:hypothetical protein
MTASALILTQAPLNPPGPQLTGDLPPPPPLIANHNIIFRLDSSSSLHTCALLRTSLTFTEFLILLHSLRASCTPILSKLPRVSRVISALDTYPGTPRYPQLLRLPVYHGQLNIGMCFVMATRRGSN